MAAIILDLNTFKKERQKTPTAMRRKALFFLLAALTSIFATAQSNKAKAVLDKTAATMRSAGDIKAEFSAASSAGSMNGTLYIHKSMLHLQSSNEIGRAHV